MFCGMIRVYEQRTREISLLPGGYHSLWQPSQTVYQLRKNLVNSFTETGAETSSYPSFIDYKRFFRKTNIDFIGTQNGNLSTRNDETLQSFASLVSEASQRRHLPSLSYLRSPCGCSLVSIRRHAMDAVCASLEIGHSAYRYFS